MSIRVPVQVVNTFVNPHLTVEKPEEKPAVMASSNDRMAGMRHPSACILPTLADYKRKQSLLQGAEASPTPRGGSNSAFKKNARLESYISKQTADFVTPEKEISTLLSAKIKQQWGVDVDPDKTYLVTFKDDSEDEKEVVEKITLTQAALKNRQDVTIKSDESWFVKIGKYFSPAIYIYNQIDGWVQEANTRQGIYREPSAPGDAPL
nr:DUF6543 domain-containing protein [Pseudomonas sp. 1079]